MPDAEPYKLWGQVSAGKTPEAPNPGYEKPEKIYLKTFHNLSINQYKLLLIRNLADVKAILIRPNSPGLRRARLQPGEERKKLWMAFLFWLSF